MNPDTNDQEITLKGLIEQAGITQRQLSKDSGIAEVTINSWVAGKYSPRLDNATLVAKTLGVSLKCLARSMGIDTKGVPDDLNFIELKRLCRKLGIERIDELPDNCNGLKLDQDEQASNLRVL